MKEQHCSRCGGTMYLAHGLDKEGYVTFRCSHCGDEKKVHNDYFVIHKEGNKIFGYVYYKSDGIGKTIEIEAKSEKEADRKFLDFLEKEHCSIERLGELEKVNGVKINGK